MATEFETQRAALLDASEQLYAATIEAWIATAVSTVKSRGASGMGYDGYTLELSVEIDRPTDAFLQAEPATSPGSIEVTISQSFVISVTNTTPGDHEYSWGGNAGQTRIIVEYPAGSAVRTVGDMYVERLSSGGGAFEVGILSNALFGNADARESVLPAIEPFSVRNGEGSGGLSLTPRSSFLMTSSNWLSPATRTRSAAGLRFKGLACHMAPNVLVSRSGTVGLARRNQA